MGKTVPVQLTEEDMLRLIQAKYSETAGNGAAWAVVPKVRDAAGFDAKRTADAVVMALWPSRGLVLHGFEIKVSRGDWLREMRKPEKAETFCRIVDFWWLAVANKTIVQDGELPTGWGLMVADRRGLRVVTNAEPLRPTVEKPPVSRSFLAALLRSATKVQKAGPAEIQAAEAALRATLTEQHKREVELQQERYQELRQKVQTFEREAGVQIDGRWYGNKHTPEEIGRVLRVVLSGDTQRAQLESRLRSMRTTAEGIIEGIDKLLPPAEGETQEPVPGLSYH